MEDHTRLLIDRGAGYLAQAFEDYLRMLQICAPQHLQTNGKLERFHDDEGMAELATYTRRDSLRWTTACFDPALLQYVGF